MLKNVSLHGHLMKWKILSYRYGIAGSTKVSGERMKEFHVLSNDLFGQHDHQLIHTMYMMVSDENEEPLYVCQLFASSFMQWTR